MAGFKPSWLLYGATGYSGGLLAVEARKRGLNVILAGRDQAALAKQGAALDLPVRVFDMAHRDAIDRGLTGVRLVLNCAGPFSLTAATLAQACLRTGAHYLDISSEMADHRAMQRLHERAVEAGVMLMPGVGIGVLPSDCLALHLKQRLPTAVSLDLAFAPGSSISRGSMATFLESLRQNGFVRRAGNLVAAEPGTASRSFDFGPGGSRRGVLFPWRADPLAAGVSTGIDHIQLFIAAPVLLRFIIKNRGLFTDGAGAGMLRRYVGKAAKGPTPAARAKSRSWLYGEAVNEVGSRVRSVLEGPDPYDLTTSCALAAVERALSGNLPEGFVSPAQLLGSEALAQLPGVKLHDST